MEINSDYFSAVSNITVRNVRKLIASVSRANAVDKAASLAEHGQFS